MKENTEKNNIKVSETKPKTKGPESWIKLEKVNKSYPYLVMYYYENETPSSFKWNKNINVWKGKVKWWGVDINFAVKNWIFWK